MLFTTPTQFAVLGLVLVAGWLLGLASHSGGRKWRERYVAERDAHAAARRDSDARIAEIERNHSERARERDNVRAAPVAAAAPVVVRETSPARPVAADAARPAHAAGAQRGWFDFGRPTTLR